MVGFHAGGINTWHRTFERHDLTSFPYQVLDAEAPTVDSITTRTHVLETTPSKGVVSPKHKTEQLGLGLGIELGADHNNPW